MHRSCIINAEKFARKYLSVDKPLLIIDVGSFNINGTLKPLFVHGGSMCQVCGRVFTEITNCCSGNPSIAHTVCDGIDFRPIAPDYKIGPSWKYKGMDLREGCAPYGNVLLPEKNNINVDILMDEPGRFPLDDKSVDVIVSTSCLEHDDCFWRTFDEMVRVVKPGGFIYLNVPSAGPYHGYPDDCWRFQKDAYKALAKWNKRARLLESYIDDDMGQTGGWSDNVGIFEVGA